MKTDQISQKITRVLLILVFLTVSGLSIYLAEEIIWSVLFFSIIKGLLAVVFAWLFFLILSDAIIKSIMVSVANMQEMRKSGGLLYHFIKPADNEILPDSPKKSKNQRKRKKSPDINRN